MLLILSELAIGSCGNALSLLLVVWNRWVCRGNVRDSAPARAFCWIDARGREALLGQPWLERSQPFDPPSGVSGGTLGPRQEARYQVP